MATDKSEPRVGLILKIGVLFVVTLVGVREALISYFDRVSTEEEHRKVAMAKPEALMALRADEGLRLQGGPEPIEHAMQDLVAKGRMGASPAIVPSASRDLAPLQGAQMMPAEVPAPMIAMAAHSGEPVSPPPAGPIAGDAGVASGRDGAAPNAPDGGHPRGPGGAGHLPRRP